MKSSPLPSAIVWLVLGMMNARAVLTISLDAPVVNVAAGNVAVFSGTLTNTGTVAKVFLNDLQVSAPAGLSTQPNAFFSNVPGILLPGETYTGPIFSVMLGAGASPADYGGTLTLSGGGDISAAGTLTTVPFTVLSPAVTIAATVPAASEFGPVSGAFAVSRTGGTGIPLSVNFTIGGTAVNGSACALIASSVSLAAGASSASVSVAPIPNNTADGDRTVLLTLAASAAYDLGAGTAATVIIHDKPADQWRVQNFGAAANTVAASDTASWAQDGVANMVKYSLGMAPTVVTTFDLPKPTMVNGYLTLSFVPNSNATDILYSVEGCPDLVAWSTGNVEAVTLANPIPPNRLTYRYRIPSGPAHAAFLRLRIDRVP